MQRSDISGSFELVDPLFSECKLYEAIASKQDLMFDKQEEANEIVKSFVRERGLILYGGEAIDGALRELGSFLYAEGTIPDYDFFSANTVEDAYDLADTLYAAGFEEARALRGMHFSTMRVDAGANHFVADLSYIPRDLFENMPTIIHEGIRGVHPSYQRTDVHRALSLPYVESPREAIFNRLTKDIARFNLINKYYPTSGLSEFLLGDPAAENSHVIPLSYLSRPLTGIVASRIYRGLYGDPTIAPVVVRGGLKVFLPAPVIERLSVDIPAVSYRRFSELTPDTHEQIIPKDLCVITATVAGKLIPQAIVRVNGIAVVLAGVQHVLWWLIAHVWAMKSKVKVCRLDISSDVYLKEYMALCELVTLKGNDVPELAPWLPSYYGDLNETTAEKMSKMSTDHERDPYRSPKPPTFPATYTPAKKAAYRPRWDIIKFEKAPH